MQYTIHADGGARGNPGPSGAGAVIRDEGGSIVGSVSKFLGHRTNNFAEYEAVILAAQTLHAQLGAQAKECDLVVKMDSELVVKQMRGEYKVKHPGLKAQYARLLDALSGFKTATFMHVPRAQNADADALANEAMDRGA